MREPISTLPPFIPDTWRGAWHASPGPRGKAAQTLLFLKGFAMGTANIIPGVSGGTIAFITGIYTPLIDAIAAFDLPLLYLIATKRFHAALRATHLRFLVPLGLGIAASTIGGAHAMHYLLAAHPIPTWALFFGLIAASILVVERDIRPWNFPTVFLATAGTLLAWWVVGLIPMRTPDTKTFVFFCGVVAICAMILPGLSGSFLILILGKYSYVIGAVRNPASVESLAILLTFGTGCVVGLAAFSRVLRYCLHHLRPQTLAVLLGFMIGAMRKVWPWKRALVTTTMGEKEVVIKAVNILPRSLDGEVVLAVSLAVFGFAAVLLLERGSRTAPQ